MEEGCNEPIGNECGIMGTTCDCLIYNMLFGI